MINWINHKLYWNKIYKDLRFFNDIEKEKILLFGYQKVEIHG